MFQRLLVGIHSLLVAWGVLGLVEYAIPSVELGLQNSAFPSGLQFIHFTSILVTGGVFLAGYFSAWRGTPFATVTLYAVLATICFIETVDFGAFGGGPTRFIPMTLEYATYIGLSIYLLRSPGMRRHFAAGFGVA
ncbi:MAG: hypothetical protein AAGD10_08320 [Myxococcota bacterium]